MCWALEALRASCRTAEQPQSSAVGGGGSPEVLRWSATPCPAPPLQPHLARSSSPPAQPCTTVPLEVQLHWRMPSSTCLLSMASWALRLALRRRMSRALPRRWLLSGQAAALHRGGCRQGGLGGCRNLRRVFTLRRASPQTPPAPASAAAAAPSLACCCFPSGRLPPRTPGVPSGPALVVQGGVHAHQLLPGQAGSTSL